MRVSVRSYDARRARALQEALAAGGVEAVALVGPLPSRTQIADDIALIDAAPEAFAWAEEEARRIARSVSRPTAIVAASRAAEPPVDDATAFDAWIQIDAPDGVVEQELVSIQRRSAARTELRRRIETARARGIATSALETNGPWRALYIGEPSPFFLAQERAFEAVDGRLEAAFSSFMGFDFLHDSRFDAVTLNATKDPATALALCGALRRNARLHHLPTAVIVKRGDTATIAGAVDRGATLIVHADEPPEPTLRWLFEKVRRGRRHAHVEAGLTALKRACMGRAGLFDADYFADHLARLADAAHLSGRPLTLAALRICLAPGARSRSADAWDRSVAQIGELAGRLVRAHDAAALLQADVIVIALPDSHAAEGRHTAERVSGVVECTSFASGEGDAGPIVLEHSVVELNAGEGGGALLVRALDPFVAEGVRA
jgi:two-component system cell cycle response regulator PopA